jgi:hypothetical protein
MHHPTSLALSREGARPDRGDVAGLAACAFAGANSSPAARGAPCFATDPLAGAVMVDPPRCGPATGLGHRTVGEGVVRDPAWGHAHRADDQPDHGHDPRSISSPWSSPSANHGNAVDEATLPELVLALIVQ